MNVLSAVLLAIWVVLMVLVTIWDVRRRKKMTPEQRRQHDQAMRFRQMVRNFP
jgi:hypothetical protein